MVKRHVWGLLLGLALLASLFTGAVAHGAQTVPDLSNIYTWQPYDLSLRYPDTWEVVYTGQAVSLRPVGQDVSDGLGPELILFTASGGIDDAARELTSSVPGAASAVARDALAGIERRSFTFQRATPRARGEVALVATDQGVVGAAFIVRASAADEYTPLLEAMLGSLQVGSRALSLTSGVASVRLPQPYVWQAAELRLHFPAAWTVEIERDLDGEVLVGTPNDLLADPSRPFRLIQASVIKEVDAPLDEIARELAADYGSITAAADATVAGYDAALFQIRDASEPPPLTVLSVIVALPERRALAVVVIGADEAEWDAFRPTASAFISSIEPAAAATSRLQRVANVTPGPRFGAARQDETQTVNWEEYGVTLAAPAAWTVLPGNGQDFDLAVVSPEARQGNPGSYLTLRIIPSLGPGATLESALAPTAEQNNSTVEPFTADNVEGFQVVVSDETAGTVHHLVLLPYGDEGGTLLLQSTATPAADEEMQALLASVAVNPPQPDLAALDAQMQANLADSGTLTVGPDDAPVKLVEFLSFTCGHCAIYSRDISNLIALEAETGRVQVRLAPLGGDALALRATQATYCAAEQGKGYSAYKALFDAYLNSSPQEAYAEEAVQQTVEALGVDMEQFNACMEDDAYQSALDQVRQEFLAAGLTGTPTVLLAVDDDQPEALKLPNGAVWSGRVPISALRAIIGHIVDDEMSVAEAAAAYFAAP